MTRGGRPPASGRRARRALSGLASLPAHAVHVGPAARTRWPPYRHGAAARARGSLRLLLAQAPARSTRRTQRTHSRCHTLPDETHKGRWETQERVVSNPRANETLPRLTHGAPSHKRTHTAMHCGSGGSRRLGAAQRGLGAGSARISCYTVNDDAAPLARLAAQRGARRPVGRNLNS